MQTPSLGKEFHPKFAEFHQFAELLFKILQLSFTVKGFLLS